MTYREIMYRFVDLTGICFRMFIDKTGETTIGRWMQEGKLFSVGDAMAFRDELTQAGFLFGKDFVLEKVQSSIDCERP